MKKEKQKRMRAPKYQRLSERLSKILNKNAKLSMT